MPRKNKEITIKSTEEMNKIMLIVLLDQYLPNLVSFIGYFLCNRTFVGMAIKYILFVD